MNTYLRSRMSVYLLVVLGLSLGALGVARIAHAAGVTYYVDCSAPTNGNGTQTSPWNSLASPNATTFAAGDSLLFKRGATCNGELIPRGSGNSTAPITLADYGTGALPVIDAGTVNTSTVYLNDVEYYDLRNLAVRGSSQWAVYITGNTAGRALNHYHVINLDITGVNHVATARNDSGLLLIWPGGSGETISDVLVDGVIAHDTTAGDGITISGGINGSGITVQNSIVHDVRGDGIVIWQHQNGLIQNSLAYNTGTCGPSCSGSTPVGIWTWNANNVTVQNNETYGNQTWNNKDGGDFDIDGQNSNNTFQYNYGHDSYGYCIAFFDWGKTNTVNSVFRYNICANNVRHDVSIGEIYMSTWQAGHLNGVQVYNNTIYANPDPAAANLAYAAVKDGASYAGTTPNFIKNNIIYALHRQTMSVSSQFTLDYNLWWAPPGVGYEFKYSNGTYTTFSAYQSGSGQDAHGKNADPLLNRVGYHGVGRPNLTNNYYTLQAGSPALSAGTNVCATSCIGGNMGTQDFYGNALGSTHNIGAYEGAAR